MTPAPTSRNLQLPEPLRARFQTLERRLWRMDTVIALCGALSGLVISYGLLFLSDRFWETPTWLRFVFNIAGMGVAIYFAVGWSRLWLWQRRDYRALAEIVQRHYRRLGDRLLGIVELADEGRRPPDISPALCRAAIHQVSAEAVQFDFRQAVAARKPKIYFVTAVLLVGLVLAPWVLVPEASSNVLSRWLWPGSKLARYTFVSLADLPARLVVPHGESFEIQCQVKPNSKWRPSAATCQFEEQPLIEAPVADNQVLFRVPGQTKPGRLKLRVGDISRQVAIEPMYRPALRKMVAQMRFPEYLQYPPAEEEVRSGAFTAVEGSEVSFKGLATRALAAAQVRFQGEAAGQRREAKAEGGVPVSAPAAAPPERRQGAGALQDLAVQGEQFQTRPLKLAAATATVTFTWRDEFGLESAAPWLLTLQSRPDTPPEVQCPEMPAVTAILEEEVLEIKVSAEDDYGLRELGVAWECQKRQETNVAARQEVQVQGGASQARTLTGSYRFAPALLRLPPDSVVTLRGVARDYFPDRPRAESAAHRIFIVSQEEHAQMIQQQFERISAELEEITRREEALQESGRELREQAADALAGEETARKLGEQAAEQAALKEKMEQLTQKGTETLREAMRNQAINPEALKEWAQHLQTMQALTQQQMPQAAQALAGAAQTQSPQERGQQMDQALKKEQEIIEKLQEMQKKVGQTLDQMLANTLAKRLRKVARTERDLGGTLQKGLAETIGLLPEQLPPAWRDKTSRLAFNQDATSREARALTEEISRFYDRTSITNYGNVAREMRDTEAAEGLAWNAELIRKNITAEALQQTGLWAKRFDDWAAELEKSQRSEGDSGESQGENEIPEEVLMRLLALLRLRQQEMNLREQTRWLEEHRATHQGYREDAIMLSLRQSVLKDETDKLDTDGTSRFLPKAHEAMDEAETLLQKPQTDKPTVDAETDAVNLLEAEILDMVKMSDNPGQSAALSQMMEAMGMSAGARGGGYRGGGEAAQSDRNVTGDPRGAGADPRATERTVGRDPKSLPVEYREALQNYFRAVEQMNP